MNTVFKLISVLLLGSLLAACASQSIKAPCDQYAKFCGTKTKINQW